MMTLRREKGFSLVELMIVVAIIAILAAIAIPSFMRFAMKSKTSEAFGNLNAIKTCQESFKAENDVYLTCDEVPDMTAGATGQLKAWVGLGTGVADFEETGFMPDGEVRYYYEVVGTATTFTATATGDLDDDDADAVYTLVNGTSQPTPPAAGVF